MGWMTSVASTNSSGAMSSMVDSPTVAYTYRDLEDAAAFYDVGFQTATSMNGGSVTILENTTNLLHPTKDERLALIRSTRTKGEVS
jgi:hypothetical protein